MEFNADSIKKFMYKLDFLSTKYTNQIGKMVSRNDIRNKIIYKEKNIDLLDKKSIITIKHTLEKMITVCDEMLVE